MALIMMMLHLQQRWVVLQRQQINSVVYLHSSPKWLQKHWKAKTKNDNNIGTTLSSCQGKDIVTMGCWCWSGDKQTTNYGTRMSSTCFTIMGFRVPIITRRQLMRVENSKLVSNGSYIPSFEYKVLKRWDRMRIENIFSRKDIFEKGCCDYLQNFINLGVLDMASEGCILMVFRTDFEKSTYFFRRLSLELLNSSQCS